VRESGAMANVHPGGGTPPRLGLLWRGPLASCNYACPRCPFAKRRPTRKHLAADRQALAAFVRFVAAARAWSLEILFSPCGEALVWPWYQEALAYLSHLPQVRRIAIQTNGSAPADFLARANRERLSLCIAWHPTEIPRRVFVGQVGKLRAAGARLSVGAVAIPEDVDELEALRRELPAELPMWLNAEKPPRQYSAEAAARFGAIDPLFPIDVRPPPSKGRPCATGEAVLFIDGAGTIRRCPFVGQVLGNLYTDELSPILAPRPCPRARCDCYIGYCHRPDLGLREVFGDDLLGRIRRGGGPAGQGHCLR
jgi:MoaA/NifB/PqqE/SkfB family radical SAM enzyme